MTEKKRFAVFPDVPTLDESGVPGYGLFDLPISRYLDLPISRPPEFTGSEALSLFPFPFCLLP